MKWLSTHRLWAATVFSCALFLASYGVAHAIQMFAENIVGTSIQEFTDEVRITSQAITGPQRVRIVVEPQPAAIALTTYTVRLYVDGTLSQSSTIQFTQTQINNQTTQAVVFNGVNLAGMTQGLGSSITR